MKIFKPTYSKLRLKVIERKVLRLAEKIGASQRHLPTFGQSMDLAIPHIEIDQHRMHYVIVERGQLLQRDTTKNIDELLYWIFFNVTYQLALERKRKNRTNGHQSRTAQKLEQAKLLGNLNPFWKTVFLKYGRRKLDKTLFKNN